MTAQLALAISFLSFCVAAVTLYRGSLWAENRQAKREKMRLVAARCILIWDQHLTIRAMWESGNKVDPYVFPSYQRNIHRLEEALDGAVAAGLFEDLVSDREYAVGLHCAFTQSLAHMEKLDPEKAKLEEWIKEHFIMGMVRLLECCIQRHKYTLSKKRRDQITQEIADLVSC